MTEAAKVLFVAPSAYPLGGVQSWLDYLLPGLRSRGWDSVLGLVSGRFHDVERYLAVHPGHKHVVVESPTGSREGRVRSLIRTIREVKPAVLVSVNICDCYAAVERMRRNGAAAPKVVMADHSLDPDYLCDARRWRHVLDGFVATNRLTERLARDYAGLPEERICYAPYGVPHALRAAGIRPKDGGCLRIAYSGRVDEIQKRAHDISAILAALECKGVDFKFRLAGGGPYLGQLQEQLRQQVERGVVEFLGVLDANALREHLYEWANVLLVTSSWETGPIVIWEAMAHELPVVSSRYVGSGLEGGLRHGINCLLFEPGDIGVGASQLARLLDPSLRQSLATNGRLMVESRYSEARSVAAWDGALRRICEAAEIQSDQPVMEFSPAGRLDRWIGPVQGDRLRQLLGLEHQHADPGSEWPHTHHRLTAAQESEYWAQARQVDRNTT